MTRSERVLLERVLLELEVEMKKVQEEMDKLRQRLKGTGATHRRYRVKERV